jgi:hypothetical protein
VRRRSSKGPVQLTIASTSTRHRPLAARPDQCGQALLVLVNREKLAGSYRQPAAPQKLVDNSRNTLGNAVTVRVPQSFEVPNKLGPLANGPGMPEHGHHRPHGIKNTLPGNAAFLCQRNVGAYELQHPARRRPWLQKRRPGPTAGVRLGQKSVPGNGMNRSAVTTIAQHKKHIDHRQARAKKQDGVIGLYLLQRAVLPWIDPYVPMLPAIARDTLHQGSTGLGFLYGAVGAGALTGAYALMQVPDRHLTLTPVAAALGFGLSLAAFSQSHWYALSLLLLAPCAFCLILLGGSTNSIIQIAAREDMRGRVVALYAASFMGMVPWGALLLGSMAERLGISLTIALGGGACICAALVSFRGRESWATTVPSSTLP